MPETPYSTGVSDKPSGGYMICYQCRNEVNEDDARTIGQCIVVCSKCYRELRALIFHGYFDVPKLEDEMIFEHNVQQHISARA